MPRQKINYPKNGNAVHISWTVADKKNKIPGWAQVALEMPDGEMGYSEALTRAELLSLGKALRRAARQI